MLSARAIRPERKRGEAMMKRTGLIILALVLGAGVVSGCAEKKQPAEKAQEAAVQAPEVKQETPSATAAPEEKAVEKAMEKAVEKKDEAVVAVKKAAVKVEEKVVEAAVAVEKAVEKPMSAAADTSAGEAIFKSKCSPCHGPAGNGTAMAPAFAGNDWIKSASAADIAGVIKNGRDGAAKRYKKFAIGMPANKSMAESDINALVAYIKSIN